MTDPITIIQTWKNPVSDVVILVVENPPAATICFADQIRRVFISIEADLPQTSAGERTLVVDSYPPCTGPEADKA